MLLKFGNLPPFVWTEHVSLLGPAGLDGYFHQVPLRGIVCMDGLLERPDTQFSSCLLVV